MRETIIVNKKPYSAKELTYNALCVFEEKYGISISELDNQSLNFLRGYVAYCMGASLDEAGREIEEHIIGGGDFKELTEVLSDALSESDFFRSLLKGEEKETSTAPKKTSKKN